MSHLRRMSSLGFSPDIVIDVGAAYGDWTASARRVFPGARFVMIEPLHFYLYDLGRLAASPDVDYYAVAAGTKAEMLPLLVPSAPSGSSFLPASREGDSYFKRSVDVEVKPLDSLAIPGGRTLLKLDVQGYELQVLEGAAAVLERTEVVIAECSLYPFQKDIPLVREVIAYLADRGFRVYDIADEVRWASGTLAQVDVVFVAETSDLLTEAHWR